MARMIPRLLTLLAAVAIGATTVAACGDGGGASGAIVPPPPRVARVDVTPSASIIRRGTAVQLRADPFDAAGLAVTGRAAQWSSSDAALVSVDQNGLATGVGSTGTATITATVDGVSGSASVSLAQALPASIRLSPGTLPLTVGQSSQLGATALDDQGVAVSGVAFTWTTDAAAVASVSQAGVVTGVAVGTAHVTAALGALSSTATVTVAAAPAGTTIDVDPSTSYQTIIGWQSTAGVGEFECNATGYSIWRPQVLQRAVNELGINGVTVAINSGYENPVEDLFGQYLAKQVSYKTWYDTRFSPVNDNADPFVANPNGFHWGPLDYRIDSVINPMRALMAARGEKLYVRLTFVNFTLNRATWPFKLEDSPDEYAEFVVEAFKHIRQKYGWEPDAFEVVLEPENTWFNGRPDKIGRAIVAAGARLRAAGFSPAIIAPSTTGIQTAPTYIDGMLAVGGVSQYVTDYSYHRYTGAISDPSAIAQRAGQRGVRAQMLEHIGSGVADLWKDLTLGNVSAWMQFSLAFCISGQTDAPGDQSVYFQINQSVPAAPRVNITNDSKLFRQIFLFVRAGAVRVRAQSSGQATVDAIAFRNANGKYVAVVRAVSGAASFTVRGLPAGTYGIKYATSSQWNVDLPDAVVGAAGTVSTSIPGAGLLTIYAR